MKERIYKNKQGSALLIAIAIMAVTMMLSLALLLVAFSLHATASDQQKSAQVQELAQTLSRQLEYEITADVFDNSLTDGTYKSDALKKYPLWFYLRYNIWQNDWQYFAEEKGHTYTYAYRYFKLTPSISESNQYQVKSKEYMDNTSILMYWEKDTATKEDKNGTFLNVMVTCKTGEKKYIVTTRYSLKVTNDGTQEIPGKEVLSINPEDYDDTVDKSEKWKWEFDERE